MANSDKTGDGVIDDGNDDKEVMPETDDSEEEPREYPIGFELPVRCGALLWVRPSWDRRFMCANMSCNASFAQVAPSKEGV